MDNRQTVQKHINAGIPVTIDKITGIPVDGEKEFNRLGLSHGFIHFKDAETGICTGFCGVRYFLENYHAN